MIFTVGKYHINLAMLVSMEVINMNVTPMWFRTTLGDGEPSGIHFYMLGNAMIELGGVYIKQAGWETPEALAEAVTTAIECLSRPLVVLHG